MSDYEDYDSDASHSSDEDDDIVFKAGKPKVKDIEVDAVDAEADETSESEKDDDEEEDGDISDFDEEENDETIFQDKPKKKAKTDELSDDENMNYADLLVDDDDDDDENENEFYLQKFNNQMKQNVISDWHPEMKQHNMNEINALCTIIRDENGNIIDNLHTTLPFMTKYEKARILGERTVQINAGAKPLVKIEKDVVDGYLIALEELAQKKIPFIIKRPMPNGGCEYWRVKDLEILV
jgi:DNA-directed RNA polymerase I, II, and III subunit RPABC2